MISMDIKNRENVRALLQKAIKDGDTMTGRVRPSTAITRR